MTKHLLNWVNHVKKWAQEHNLKYSQALKSSECGNAYKNKESSESVVAEVKPKRKYTRKVKEEIPTEIQLVAKRKYTRKVSKIPDPIQI